MSAPSPPELEGRSSDLWSRVVETWELDPHQLEVLRLACEALDRADQARLILNSEGLTVVDRYGEVKPHPAASIETTNRAQVAQLIKDLNLEPPEPAMKKGKSIYV